MALAGTLEIVLHENPGDRSQLYPFLRFGLTTYMTSMAVSCSITEVNSELPSRRGHRVCGRGGNPHARKVPCREGTALPRKRKVKEALNYTKFTPSSVL